MMGQHPRITAVMAVGIATFAVWRMVAHHGPSQPQPHQWFFDTQARTLFRYDGDQLPPIQTTTGADAVKAYVFAKGDCTAPQIQNIAYLERWSEAGKAHMRNPSAGGPVRDSADKHEPLQYVAVPNEKGELQWYDAASNTGRNIQAREKQYRDQGMIDCDWH